MNYAVLKQISFITVFINALMGLLICKYKSRGPFVIGFDVFHVQQRLLVMVQKWIIKYLITQTVLTILLIYHLF